MSTCLCGFLIGVCSNEAPILFCVLGIADTLRYLLMGSGELTLDNIEVFITPVEIVKLNSLLPHFPVVISLLAGVTFS